MSNPSNRRNAGRMVSQRLRCELGEVVDLSGGGMRVTTTRFGQIRPGDEMQLHLESRNGAVQVGAKIAWVRRVGLRKRQVGLSFVNLDDGARAALWRVAKGVGPRSDAGSSPRQSVAVREADWREMIHVLNATG